MVAIVTDVHYRMSPALIRDLGQAGVEVITCEWEDYVNLPGAASRYAGAHRTLPADGYADALLELCREMGEKRNCRPALLPVGAGTLAMLARERQRFEEVCGLCIPTSEQLELLNSKMALGALAEQLRIPVPESLDADGALPLPCVIKPDWGEGLGLPAAGRYVIAKTPEQAKAAVERFRALSGGKPLAQEYLSGPGLGCSVVADNGRVVAGICHRRLREYPVSGGPSSCCERVQRPELEEYAARIVERLGYTGLVMFEFKEDGGGNARLLEANPRIWGTFPLTRAAKSGMALAWCTLAWNRGNPENAAALPDLPAPRYKKLVFAASDLAAAAGYIRTGRPGTALRTLGDAVNPFVSHGVFEWGDPRPGFAYLKTLLQRGRRTK